jgi:L-rhamnose isomerase
MNNGITEHWKRVKTRHGAIWIDPEELARAKARGRVYIKCWKRKDGDSETLHIENIV